MHLSPQRWRRLCLCPVAVLCPGCPLHRVLSGAVPSVVLWGASQSSPLQGEPDPRLPSLGRCPSPTQGLVQVPQSGCRSHPLNCLAILPPPGQSTTPGVQTKCPWARWASPCFPVETSGCNISYISYAPNNAAEMLWAPKANGQITPGKKQGLLTFQPHWSPPSSCSPAPERLSSSVPSFLSLLPNLMVTIVCWPLGLSVDNPINPHCKLLTSELRPSPFYRREN